MVRPSCPRRMCTFALRPALQPHQHSYHQRGHGGGGGGKGAGVGVEDAFELVSDSMKAMIPHAGLVALATRDGGQSQQALNGSVGAMGVWRLQSSSCMSH